MKKDEDFITNPLEILECVLAFDNSLDYTLRHNSMLYAIVFGYTEDKYKELGWTEESIQEYKEYHKMFDMLKKLKLPLPQKLEINHFTEHSTDWQAGWNACVDCLMSNVDEDSEKDKDLSGSKMSARDASIGLIGIQKHLTPKEAMAVSVALEALRERDDFRESAVKMCPFPVLAEKTSTNNDKMKLVCPRCRAEVAMNQKHCTECGQMLSYRRIMTIA